MPSASRQVLYADSFDRYGSTGGVGRIARIASIAAIVAAHGAVLALLASLDVVPLPPQLATLMVHIVAPQPAAEISPPAPPRPPTPPRVVNKPPLPVRPRPVAATPVSRPTLAAQSDAPGAAAETPATREPSQTDASPPPAARSGGSAATVAAPRFDAGYLRNPAPAYPALSRKMGEEGRVVLRVLVDAGGRPSRIEISSSSAWPRLDQAAQDAVWRWTFVAAKRGDEAIDAWVLVPIVFNLRS